ncbi:C1 family peptidase [Woeseia oceani]|uniref:Peptidase C1A papain C-terminal domain-containing protein n=1 Tax=Woeseia oceani TaxID=1548547 RepID=A0A193LF49_9GAMM|nr:C1 family peptidase [Woeseia oceani]ANO51155.1 hypothetical protein BA177_08010 [Woeseia oceani]
MPDTTAKLGKYELNVVADVPDFRDWTYQPALVQLANEIERPTRLHILDQGTEGSCTGFALAAVVNLQRAQSRRRGTVSARMLYEMAKRHDEWRGDSYDGSSCRGAIKGWYNMGVCLDRTWPYKDGKQGMLTIKAAKEARENTLGAYYRLGTRVSDFHAALNETGVIFCSADIHSGWSNPSKKTGIIPLRDEAEGAHAFSIVGYNKSGFWVQNSWGRKWGQDGTALWLYEDWQHHLLDAWVLRLALPTPQIWHLPREGGSDAGRTEGLFRKTPTRAEIAGHFVHIDDGRFHDDGIYWSNLDDVRQTAELVAKSDKYDHLLLYAHGGLNSVKDSARRIAAMKETFKANRIYPYHFMYDTGLLEELRDVVGGRHDEVNKRAGGLSDWTDRLIERLTKTAGRALWREMKYGAQRPFADDGAGTAILSAFVEALATHNPELKLHVAGHSTGAILHAYLLEAATRLSAQLRISSASLLAPAATTDLFRSHYQPLLTARKPAAGIDRMDIYNLSNKLELDDTVTGVYRKSLLYLVSRAFEEEPHPASILGMQEYCKPVAGRLSRLKLHVSDGDVPGTGSTKSETHGGFDNDPATMNSVLKRILGKKPAQPFTGKSLKY